MTRVSMTSLMTWTVLCLCLLRATEGGKEEGGGSSPEATPYAPPREDGLFAVVQNLVSQMAEMNNKQSRNWTRLRRVERRGKSARHDIDVMHADILQLRQHVLEINGRLDRLDDLTSDLRLEVTKVSQTQQKLREDVGKVRHAGHVTGGALAALTQNVSAIESWRTSTQLHVERIHGWSHALQESQAHVVASLHDLGARINAALSPRPRSTAAASSSSSSAQPQSSGQQDNGGSIGGSEGGGTRSPKHPPDHAPASRAPPVFPELHQGFQNRPQGDESPGRREKDEAGEEVGEGGGGPTTPLATTIPSLVGVLQTDASGDGEDPELGSGEDDDEFFTVEEVEGYHPETGTRVGGGAGAGNVEEGATPTPLTTITLPTLTHPPFTLLPTSPFPLCPTRAEFLQLERRVDELTVRVEEGTSPSSRDLLHGLINRADRLESAAAGRGRELERVESDVVDLEVTVSRLIGKVGSLRLSDYIDRLQGSIANFTSSVMTMEQWETASQQIMNATERTQRRVTELGDRVTQYAQMTSDLQMTQEEQRAMGARQYRTLQTHVIRLNNSVEDLQEWVDMLASRKSYPQDPTHNQFSGPGPKGGHQQVAVLTSRLGDLTLQMVYSDNRLRHVENQLLNSSLNACLKTNSDLYQDASLVRMNQQMSDAQHDLVILKDTVKRLDLGLYRLHGSGKATQDALRKVKGQVNDVVPVVGVVGGLRSEVDNLLFQTPIDCEGYYERGYRQSGVYVIYPRSSAHSLKVYCVMQTTDDDVSDDDSIRGRRKKQQRDGGEKRKRAESGWMEDGGWTVIHQRDSGKENFTRSWADYTMGFGTPPSEYWLGNEAVHLLTRNRNYTLLLTLTDIFGVRWRATYRPFSLGAKGDHYRLSLGSYQGNATDSLRYAAGMTFSTSDMDTDASSSHCARYNGGGWWYSHCQISNLNGPIQAGMIWFHMDWKDYLQLRQASMMIRPFLEE